MKLRVAGWEGGVLRAEGRGWRAVRRPREEVQQRNSRAAGDMATLFFYFYFYFFYVDQLI